MSEVILFPCLIAPRSRVINRLVPMGFVRNEEKEYILSQFDIAIGAIKDYTLVFRRAVKTIVMQTSTLSLLLQTLGDIPVKYAIIPKVEEYDVLELDRFIDDLSLEKLTTIEASNIKDFTRYLVSLLVGRYGYREIRPLPHMIVYSPSEKILTRVCWIDGLEGSIDIYRKGTLIVLVTDKINIRPIFVETPKAESRIAVEDRIVPELVDKIDWYERLFEMFQNELVRLRSRDVKRRITELLTGTTETRTEERPTEAKPSVETEKVEERPSEEGRVEV